MCFVLFVLDFLGWGTRHKSILHLLTFFFVKVHTKNTSGHLLEFRVIHHETQQLRLTVSGRCKSGTDCGDEALSYLNGPTLSICLSLSQHKWRGAAIQGAGLPIRGNLVTPLTAK